MIKEALSQFYNPTDNRNLQYQLYDLVLTNRFITSSSYHELFVGVDTIETDRQ